ncbi:hypothetical protein DVH24_004510 [Malus domestica]|uniref:non-specific serine/threonine protein kinase n=1 Tax=Malus domestica TaxID=3750 RepID=A0A498IAY3_MALDO|nr:hypothetical protein DVH24_004510 [Malus domestica]
MIEYDMGDEVSILGDVYSFGILLLEMFTGKRPTDGMLGDGISIHNFTAMAMPNHATDIVDASLLIEGEDADDIDDRYEKQVQEKPIKMRHNRGLLQGRKLEECLASVICNISKRADAYGYSCQKNEGKRMEHSSSTQVRLFKLFYGFILLCMGTAVLESATLPSSGTSLGNETDHMALLDFKKRISEDPFHIMSSWNDSIHFCSWAGVTCNRITKRVLTLELESQKLVGSIPPSIGNLTFLTAFNLRRNNFHGELPQELGRLQSLQHLNLSVNSFSGKIPTNISHCTQLRVLELYSNKLIGPIPDQLSSLLDLNILLFDKNNLTGTIPSWIGNFSSLCSLYIGGNNFQGSIPKELGRLTGLQAFSVAANNLSGMVPSSIYNISSISIFGVSQNQLHGELPPNVGVILPNLEQFHFGSNKFTGNVPASFSNASRLRYLNLPENDLTGTVPGESLGRLRSLVGLNFGANRLGTGKSGDLNFISFLANCTSLEGLALYDNQFRDELPSSISNLSTQLTSLTMEKNLIYGSIDRGIANLYGMGGEVSILGDVYSFGILLLEMFTRKRPTDGMFGDGLSIHNFTAMAIPDHAMDIVDPSLLIEGEDADANDDRYENEVQENPTTNRHDRGLVQGGKLDECLVSVMQIGLACSAISTGERMHMDFGMVGQISVLGDVYIVGILFLARKVHRKKDHSAFGDGISIHKFTARTMSDHVVDIADPALLYEGGDTDYDDRYRNDT